MIAAEPRRAVLEHALALARQQVAILEAELGCTPTSASADRFIVTKLAAPMLGIEYANAKKLAQDHGELLHGRRGFRMNFIASFRESRGLPPLL